MAEYVLWNEIEYDNIRVSPPKKNEIQEGTKGKKGKKITWYGCAVTYLYPNGEDAFRVMWDNLDICGITESEFEDKKTGKITTKEQVGSYNMLRPEHIATRDKIRETIILRASEHKGHKDADEDSWETIEPKNKKIKIYWKSKEDKTKARVYFPVNKNSNFYTVSKASKDGWKLVPKKNLIETEEIKLQITADVIELFKYLYVGQNISIIYELYQALIKKIARKDSTPIFKKPKDEDVDEDAIDSALRDISEKKKQRADSGDEDEDEPKPKGKKKSSAKGKLAKVLDGDSDEEDDEPKKGKKKGKKEESEDEDDDEPKKDKKKGKKEESEDEDDEPKKKPAKKPAKKEESEDEDANEEEEEEPKKKPSKKPAKKEESEEEEEEDE